MTDKDYLAQRHALLARRKDLRAAHESSNRIGERAGIRDQIDRINRDLRELDAKDERDADPPKRVFGIDEFVNNGNWMK